MSASAILLGTLAALDLSRPLGAAAVLVVVGAYSLTGPLGAAGIRTLLPLLVPEVALVRANALDTGSFALIEVLGAKLFTV